VTEQPFSHGGGGESSTGIRQYGAGVSTWHMAVTVGTCAALTVKHGRGADLM